MGSDAGNPANKGAPGRKKDAINFVNARPASETERLDIKRLVRAHVGKWISTQTKDRAAGSAVAVDPPLVTSAERSDSAAQAFVKFELDSDDPYLPSTSASSTLSPASSASSRASPESCISSSSHTALPIWSASPLSQPEFSLAVIPSRTIIPSPILDTNHSQCDGQDGCQLAGSPGSDTPSPPHSGEYIEFVGAGCLDPFRAYPSQFEPELIRISEEYCLSCLWPGLTPGPSGTNMQSWFPMSLSDPTLFTAFLYGSLSHMRVQALNGWIPQHLFRTRQQRMLEHVEMETIQLVSREMDNPSRAVCDAMIFSVVCMAHNKADDNLSGYQSSPFTAPMQRLQWLDVYGSLRTNLVHIGGLVQMINLRGGIDKIQLPGLSSVISFSDLVTSSTFLSHPIFPFVPLEKGRQNRTMQQLLGYTDANVDHYYSHFQHLGLPRILAEILCAMNTYTELVAQCLEGQMSYDPCLLADQRNIVHYTLLSLPHAPLQPDQTQKPNDTFFTPQPQDIIYETTRLACLIYSVGVVLPLPAQSTPITKLADLLYNALQVSNHPMAWKWPQAQVVLLWILTLGGISATYTPHRSWYVGMLSRVVEHNKITSYEDLKRYLVLLAWYPTACEKPGIELWAEMEKARGF
ncbi:hypothetical protein BDW59DRAFT_83005 [Aspergillus cavernicola]|uniref:Fungal-specific transcription factor domain-containing protein n=1 Tax=Aspergillus cavernicola TaxID=176166 RepID=A0ABR4IBX0_9EURO